MPSYTKVASGSIVPHRFVKLDTSAADKVLQAGAGDVPYGVAHPGTRNVPGDLNLDDGYIAISGENVAIYGPPEKDILLEYGGTVSIGDKLKPSTGGVAVTTTTDHEIYGAIAMQAGVTGTLGKVQLVPPTAVSA